jgi:hypothetical protein
MNSKKNIKNQKIQITLYYMSTNSMNPIKNMKNLIIRILIND